MSQPAVAALAPLPFELVYDDGVPLESEWHVLQLPLLRSVIRQAMAERGRTDFYIGTNMFVYYSVEQAREVAREMVEDLPWRAFRGPDVFWIGGASRHMRKAWVSWEEGGRLPDLIIELLSPSTAHVDRGKKKDLYARVFRTKEYYMADPEPPGLEGFDLAGRVYRPKPLNAEGRLWSDQLGAYFGFWHGVWMDYEADWFRLFRADGSLVPTAEEDERQRADAAEQRAEAEHQQAKAERQRAESAEAEIARLRALLKEQGRG
ncbi:MAG TPA: Uma2 family endonuclease [Thermoanaerobaculia bacterium]